ncbi:MAG: glutamine-hydrolyzing GMP synthase, partial [Clostridia bacterium]|nr:glutamine-hydrolyzing GMP synthase [Clostridia bacterium]
MDRILVLDFGGQYNQLIARRIRAKGVYAEIKPYNKITCADIKAAAYAGIVFTGGPHSVYGESSPHFSPDILKLGIPILGICYGHQLIAYMAGGVIAPAEGGSEYGKTDLFVDGCPIFKGIPQKSHCFMSHTDYVKEVPAGFRVVAKTPNCPCGAMWDEKNKIYGVQFHPEVTHTEFGEQLLYNFIFNVCRAKGDWQMDDFIKTSIEKYKTELKDKKVLLALSGGVDSSVAAVLLNKAIGKNLYCVLVDHGLMRKCEGDFVENTIGKKLGVNVIRVNAKEQFLTALSGVTDPEEKRHIIGEEFIRAFEKKARELGKIDILAQGTIYPDVIESGKGDSAKIKSHHNVGGLPDIMDFEKIVEPLRDLFKDEVREVGVKLGIPKELVYRQPFPGPGLAVRVVGEITDEKL